MKYDPISQRYGEKNERFYGVYSSQYRASQPLSPPVPLDVGWYLIQTKRKQENVAKENLERQKDKLGDSVECYNPQKFVDKKTKEMNSGDLESLFGGYVFLRLSVNESDWSVIRSTRGVLNLVRFGLQPARAPDSLIQSLKSRENELGIHGERHEYSPGDEVEIVNKQFMEYATGFYKQGYRDRVDILMTILGAETIVSLKRTDIRPIS